MEPLSLEQLHIASGTIQELTEKDYSDNSMLCIRWKGGLMLKLSYKWNYYWIVVKKDDSTFKVIRLDKEKYIMENLQEVISLIEQGEFAKRKSTAELVAEIIQEKQLTSCMNNTKWHMFRNAMVNEMPFRPPYEIKTLFDNDDAFIADFIVGDVYYQGDYDEEDFVDLNYKVIEYLVVKTKYCDITGGSLVQNKVWHDATEAFVKLMKKYHIPYEKLEDAFIVYGYRK